eukprot:679694-Prorocentrum_minimum.AAC.2
MSNVVKHLLLTVLSVLFKLGASGDLALWNGQAHAVGLLIAGKVRALSHPLATSSFIKAVKPLWCNGMCRLYSIANVDNLDAFSPSLRRAVNLQVEDSENTPSHILGNARNIQFFRRSVSYQSLMGLEKRLGLSFQWVVVVRPDLYFYSKLPNPLDLKPGIYARYLAASGRPANGLFTDQLLLNTNGHCHLSCREYLARYATTFQYRDPMVKYCPYKRETYPERISGDCYVIEDLVAVVHRQSAQVFFSFTHDRLYYSDDVRNKTQCFVDGTPEHDLTGYLLNHGESVYPLHGLWKLVTLPSQPGKSHFNINKVSKLGRPVVQKARRCLP